MPSLSLMKWNKIRVSALNEIENAHQQVGGIGRGRRYATQQINRAYAVLYPPIFKAIVAIYILNRQILGPPPGAWQTRSSNAEEQTVPISVE